jgi:hypothetical protein
MAGFPAAAAADAGDRDAKKEAIQLLVKNRIAGSPQLRRVEAERRPEPPGHLNRRLTADVTAAAVPTVIAGIVPCGNAPFQARPFSPEVPG